MALAASQTFVPITEGRVFSRVQLDRFLIRYKEERGAGEGEKKKK